MEKVSWFLLLLLLLPLRSFSAWYSHSHSSPAHRFPRPKPASQVRSCGAWRRTTRKTRPCRRRLTGPLSPAPMTAAQYSKVGPDTTQTTQWLRLHAFNDYYLKHGLTIDNYSFDNNAALTSLNSSQSQKLFFFFFLYD